MTRPGMEEMITQIPTPFRIPRRIRKHAWIFDSENVRCCLEPETSRSISFSQFSKTKIEPSKAEFSQCMDWMAEAMGRLRLLCEP